MDFATGMSAVKTAYGLFSELRKELSNNPEMKPDLILARLGEVQNLLLDSRTALADVDEENRKLKRQIEELTEKLNKKGKIKPGSGVYWLEREDGTLEDTPLCPICYVKDGKEGFLAHEKGEYWWCYIHTTSFPIKVFLGTERLG